MSHYLQATMQKIFNETFQAQLYEAVQAIEKESDAEIVTIAYSHSDSYRAVSLTSAAITTYLSYSVLMFAPTLISDFTLYVVPILVFMGTFFLIDKVNFVKQYLIPKKKKEKNVEIYARALFQKAGIHHTERHTGLLIFISLLEKKVQLIPDRGIQNAIKSEDWGKIQAYFDAIFETNEVEKGILKALEQCKSIFALHLPILPDDINELPDYIEISL